MLTAYLEFDFPVTRLIIVKTVWLNSSSKAALKFLIIYLSPNRGVGVAIFTVSHIKASEPGYSCIKLYDRAVKKVFHLKVTCLHFKVWIVFVFNFNFSYDLNVAWYKHFSSCTFTAKTD